MADARLEWHGEEAKRRINRKIVQVLYKCVTLIAGRAKELLGVAGTDRVKGKKVGPVVRSKPGEPPRKQTGTLRRSVQVEVDEQSLTARVGTNVDYGKHLELGTRRSIKPRPWLRPAFLWATTRINAWLSTLSGDL